VTEEKLPNGLTKREHFALEIYKQMIGMGVHRMGNDGEILDSVVHRADGLLHRLETPRGR
jgi:hypothetical protein